MFVKKLITILADINSCLVARSGQLLSIVLVAGVMTLTACASAPVPPTQQLQAAALAITSAEQARVAEYAASELNQAREKLASANIAVQNDEMELASRLADESRVYAELALANTEMLKAREVNQQMQESINILQQEIQRNTGSTP